MTTEPRDLHAMWCLIWVSSDPVDDCDCGGDDFQAGVEAKLQLFESYAGPA